ncbi:MAG TPA: prepilin-type N-terminal cleavage/methylation domain-containing protein [Terriglobales bacterium]|nr:prepilin-type N-terminal cleavage/methylation domain-containing protein [Terriglobales bacterium]
MMRNNKRAVAISRSGESAGGFTLIEMMISMTVMAIGLLGLNVMFVTAMATNNKNSHDSSATMISQVVLEQISAQPANSTATITVTDCAGNTNTVATAGSTTGAGAPLLTTGNVGTIDQTAAKVANYSMTYVACAPAGSNLQSSYDVRWNVMTISPDTRMITVSARQTSGIRLGALHFAVPVNLRSIGGR